MKKREPRKSAELATGADFRNPVIIGPGLLVLDAEANSAGNKEADWVSYTYLMKIRVKTVEGAVKLSLVEARKDDGKDAGSRGQVRDGQLGRALEEALAKLGRNLNAPGGRR